MIGSSISCPIPERRLNLGPGRVFTGGEFQIMAAAENLRFMDRMGTILLNLGISQENPLLYLFGNLIRRGLNWEKMGHRQLDPMQYTICGAC